MSTFQIHLRKNENVHDATQYEQRAAIEACFDDPKPPVAEWIINECTVCNGTGLGKYNNPTEEAEAAHIGTWEWIAEDGTIHTHQTEDKLTSQELVNPKTHAYIKVAGGYERFDPMTHYPINLYNIDTGDLDEDGNEIIRELEKEFNTQWTGIAYCASCDGSGDHMVPPWHRPRAKLTAK